MAPRPIRTALLGAALLLAGCASADPRLAPRLGEHRIGPMRVVILDEGTVDLACQARRPEPGRRYEGCWVPGERTIISRNDVGVLLHELKHALDREWTH
ncbi:MAG: hypothetical protein A3E31_11820 [Candidatus Rokubacteria bacterium RIFCSPHIGHO2_12_FULL_73_22]|nr:MAG: hypothetical protein A3D33_00935 [Candidatus Rokubacteria bacterium RIFCSPHIGHO2_02_FULL_73_26]OGL00480.1 MAG: hypothetical protein A3E31_11820 [Candidatus Rokubacteria bacterium RIFCSPHIGHO2_12_FULL_73_22]OGL09229.1 MAG: hypothetical protein A3I14_18545 [Candidatus Rokubacteria bacterium RIFCSPLOWO2_02_FULL_73_56]OGL27935.1 MAG: hypothetical protein A3G44_04090 [Candidatus Rokubacteria bacterium RIFCSPLOWO2_12_FULL_73_47]